MTHEETHVAKAVDVRPLRRLLVVCSPFENNDAILANAVSLAKTWNASVSALTVLELPTEIDHISSVTNMSREDILNRITAESREELLMMWNRVAPELKPAINVRVGKLFLETIQHVFANDVDMVFKTIDEPHSFHRYLFSSTDQHLLRKCPCPVWLWRSGNSPSVRNVLAAVDVDETAASEPETLAGLNRRIVKTAAQIAAVEGGIVTLLHVWDAPDEEIVRRWSNSIEVAEAYVERVRARRKQALDRLAEKAQAWAGPDLAQRVVFEPLLERGVARSTIPELLRERKAELLVMGTIARTGVPGFFIGNTAEDILNSVDCSVVTVKPPNYLSPLQAHVVVNDGAEH